MIEKWVTRPWGERIMSELVERETDTSVFIGGRRNTKITAYRAYHDTWDQAHAYLLEGAERELAQARRALEVAQTRRDNIKGMKPPPPQAPKETENDRRD